MKQKQNSGFIPYSALQFTKLIHNIPVLTSVSLMSHPVSQKKTWHPVISDSMRLDLTLVSLMSHPVPQRKTWHPVISDSMRVDLILVSLMSHSVSQRKTWHPVNYIISDSMSLRVDLIIVNVPLNFHVYVSSASQVL